AFPGTLADVHAGRRRRADVSPRSLRHDPGRTRLRSRRRPDATPRLRVRPAPAAQLPRGVPAGALHAGFAVRAEKPSFWGANGCGLSLFAAGGMGWTVP